MMPMSTPMENNGVAAPINENTCFSYLAAPNLGVERVTPSCEVQIDRSLEGGLSVRIETPRLILSSVTGSESFVFHQLLYGDPRVMEKFATGITRDLEYVRGRVSTWADRWRHGDPFAALSVQLKDETYLGLVVVGHGDEPGHAEVSYLMRADAWGNRYGSEAAAAAVQQLAPLLRAYGYQVEGAPFAWVEATARPDNFASCKILNSCGMEVVSTSEKFGAIREHFKQSVPTPGMPSTFEALMVPSGVRIRETVSSPCPPNSL